MKKKTQTVSDEHQFIDIHACSFEKGAENYMYLNLSVQSYDSVRIVLLNFTIIVESS